MTGTSARHPSRGTRFTERFLLPFFGPAELGDGRPGRGTTAEERRRDETLHAGLIREVGGDGRPYLVIR